MRLTIIITAIAAIVSLPATGAVSRSAKQQLQTVITKQGRSCPKVTAARGFATTEDGAPLIAVACSNGDRHVIKLDAHDRPIYMFPCNAMEASSHLKCFGGRR